MRYFDAGVLPPEKRRRGRKHDTLNTSPSLSPDTDTPRSFNGPVIILRIRVRGVNYPRARASNLLLQLCYTGQSAALRSAAGEDT